MSLSTLPAMSHADALAQVADARRATRRSLAADTTPVLRSADRRFEEVATRLTRAGLGRLAASLHAERAATQRMHHALGCPDDDHLTEPVEVARELVAARRLIAAELEWLSQLAE